MYRRLMNIRDATVGDAGAIATVRVLSWQEAYRGLMPQDALDSLSIERNTQGWAQAIEASTDVTGVIVSEDDDAVISGFCSFGPGRGGDTHEGEIYALYVLPERWRSGLGRALQAEATDRLRGFGFTEAFLWVLSTNEPARAFYDRSGWIHDGGEMTSEAFGFEAHEVRYRRSL